MSAHLAPAPSENLAGQAADAQASDTEYYRRVLHRLIDKAADMVDMIHQQAVERAQPAAELAVPLDRMARTLRRTVMLARKLDEPLPVASHPGQHRAAARRHVIRGVEDTIQRHAADSEAEALHDEFLDRLDSPDVEDDIVNRPLADIVAEICRDLGLTAPPGTHPWKRRTPEDVAALCARAAACPAGPAASPDPPLVPTVASVNPRTAHPQSPRPPPPD